MATKTWKIGEYCKGGIITVETRKTQITIIGKEWDYSKGSKKGSNQANAKEWIRKTVLINEDNPGRELSNFLSELTTSYYTGEIMKWIEQTNTFKRFLFW